MKLALFDCRAYDRESFTAANAAFGHALTFLEPRLTAQTSALARGHGAVCSFVNDSLDREAVASLASAGVSLVALRCAGYDHVDLVAAKENGLRVVRVPAYSPHAVAEHAVALVLSLSRKLHRAYARVREWDFRLDGLVGFDLHGKTAGIVGTGRIGAATATILRGFGCRVLAYDRVQEPDLLKLGVTYVPLDTLLAESDIVSLHLPLNASTRHLLDAPAFARMKKGVILVNTGRGGLVETAALIEAIKSEKLGAVGLDVYEREAGLFFADHSAEVVQDDALARLLSFPNVLLTAHQAFLTREALHAIAATTLASLTAFERGEALEFAVV